MSDSPAPTTRKRTPAVSNRRKHPILTKSQQAIFAPQVTIVDPTSNLVKFIWTAVCKYMINIGRKKLKREMPKIFKEVPVRKVLTRFGSIHNEGNLKLRRQLTDVLESVREKPDEFKKQRAELLDKRRTLEKKMGIEAVRRDASNDWQTHLYKDLFVEYYIGKVYEVGSDGRTVAKKSLAGSLSPMPSGIHSPMRSPKGASSRNLLNPKSEHPSPRSFRDSNSPISEGEK
jgi:hypothetical protein